MNIHDLWAAQVRFESRLADFTSTREEMHRIRADFVRYFTRIRLMSVDDYVVGVIRSYLP